MWLGNKVKQQLQCIIVKVQVQINKDDDALLGVTHVHTKTWWTLDCWGDLGSRLGSMGYGCGIKGGTAATAEESGPKVFNEASSQGKCGEWNEVATTWCRCRHPPHSTSVMYHLNGIPILVKDSTMDLGANFKISQIHI
ncbi:hypothetical protein E2C01_079509 [Portunus trituberculatus]|uniref:Uncharacterized protein n=1 Tax=Portunus trituberculatus TaxID=210409 RepID=A0A5B7IJR3_PORTR|nr:hypothetical protein [Portunus trituberculatus]